MSRWLVLLALPGCWWLELGNDYPSQAERERKCAQRSLNECEGWDELCERVRLPPVNFERSCIDNPQDVSCSASFIGCDAGLVTNLDGGLWHAQNTCYPELTRVVPAPGSREQAAIGFPYCVSLCGKLGVARCGEDPLCEQGMGRRFEPNRRCASPRQPVVCVDRRRRCDAGLKYFQIVNNEYIEVIDSCGPYGEDEDFPLMRPQDDWPPCTDGGVADAGL